MKEETRGGEGGTCWHVWRQPPKAGYPHWSPISKYEIVAALRRWPLPPPAPPPSSRHAASHAARSSDDRAPPYRWSKKVVSTPSAGCLLTAGDAARRSASLVGTTPSRRILAAKLRSAPCSASDAIRTAWTSSANLVAALAVGGSGGVRSSGLGGRTRCVERGCFRSGSKAKGAVGLAAHRPRSRPSSTCWIRGGRRQRAARAPRRASPRRGASRRATAPRAARTRSPPPPTCRGRRRLLPRWSWRAPPPPTSGASACRRGFQSGGRGRGARSCRSRAARSPTPCACARRTARRAPQSTCACAAARSRRRRRPRAAPAAP